MKKTGVILIMSLFCCYCFAQTNRKFFVADSITNQPVEYACIVFVGVEGGTYSNENGISYIPQNIKQIELSSIGYSTKIIDVSETIDTIFLNPKIYEISEAKILPAKKKRKPVELGYANEHKNYIYIQSSCSGEEIVVYIPLNSEENSLRKIKQVIIRSDENAFSDIKSNFDDINFTSVFKINFYKATENKEIGEIINTEDIVFTSEVLKSKTKLNVGKYNVYMPENGIFVAVEWVGKINPETKEIITDVKGGIKPHIRTAWKIPNTIVYERRRFMNLNNNTWQRIDKNNKMVKQFISRSKYLKEGDIYTPLFSIVLE